jgi:adenylylsulfate reductase subunit B
MPPIIDKGKCHCCGTCVDICPLDVLHFSDANSSPDIRYPEECWHCNACKLDCPTGAIELRIPLPATLLYTAACRH